MHMRVPAALADRQPLEMQDVRMSTGWARFAARERVEPPDEVIGLSPCGAHEDDLTGIMS